MPERRAFTIGHSTHAIDAFGRDALARELRAAGIAYAHLESYPAAQLRLA